MATLDEYAKVLAEYDRASTAADDVMKHVREISDTIALWRYGTLNGSRFQASSQMYNHCERLTADLTDWPTADGILSSLREYYSAKEEAFAAYKRLSPSDQSAASPPSEL